MKLDLVLKEELDRICVPRNEVLKLERIAKDFIKLLKGSGLNGQIGGSLAKGTLIRKDGLQDIDIFVVFEYSEDISSLGNILKKIELPGELNDVHGSRDYFQIKCEEAILEVIPVVKNKDPELAENVTDVSLSHVKYVKGEIDKNNTLADQIKLAKAFCQGNGFYGAEGYIRGFSGYSLEVLVIYFGGFDKFLKDIGKSKVIDPLKYFRNQQEIMREINSSKLNSPLIVVDPTYKYRNVTAGLGLETYSKFLEVAKDFLKNPDLSFFENKELDLEELKNLARERNARFIDVEIETDRQEGDIAGTKCKKFLDFFEAELIRKQQEVLKKEFIYLGYRKSKGYLIVREKKEIEVRGPEKGMDEAVKKFKESRGEIFLKSGYWFTKEKTSVEEVFELVNRSGKEMGAWGKLV